MENYLINYEGQEIEVFGHYEEYQQNRKSRISSRHL
jgi:hypothetical protein